MTHEWLSGRLEDYGENYQLYQQGCSVSADSWVEEAASKMQKIEDALLAAFNAGVSINKELEIRIAELLQQNSEEVAEFNAGYEAYHAGILIDEEPLGLKHDQWRIGWAWAAFEPMQRRITELETALDDLLMAIDLPGDHCELEQAKRRAEAAIAKARGGMR